MGKQGLADESNSDGVSRWHVDFMEKRFFGNPRFKLLVPEVPGFSVTLVNYFENGQFFRKQHFISNSFPPIH